VQKFVRRKRGSLSAPLPAEHIAQSILFLRGQRVILDRELAAVYGVETRTLNQAVKRNGERFPEDFMFQLNQDEVEGSRSQSVILNSGRGHNIKYLPYAFTEHDRAIGALLSAIRKLMHPKAPVPKRRPIGFTADLEEKG
jgi:hypothetical protein